MIEVRAASRTDVGRTRPRNEDAVFVGTHVFAVADGMGGHRAGEVASSLALEPLAALDRLDPRRAADGIAEGVRKANRAVFERADVDDGLKGMGTTMTALVISGAAGHLAHVGDSRCYLIRGDEITQMSRDHTLVARMVSEGKLTPEQAEVHPQRSMLTRALGADRDIDVDEVRFDLEPGDRVLLCSDGLTAMLSDEEIRVLSARERDPQTYCDVLIDEANARGGLDNISAIVVEVGGTLDGVRAPAARPSRRDADRPRVSRRLLAWLAVIVLVTAGGFFAVRAWTQSSYYVGIDGDRVAIFRGLPVRFAGISLSEVEERTSILVDDVADYYVGTLREGVRTDSLEDARRLVAERIPRDTRRTPSPGASP